MALALKVSTDHAALKKKLAQSVKRYPRAAAAGINRAAQGAFTHAVRAIQEDVGTSAQKTIRRNLTVKNATAEKPEARLIGFSAKKDRIPIYELKPAPRSVTRRRPEGGVRYGAAKKLLPGSFIARMKSGHVGVFKRLEKTRTPLDELHGPSVALVFSRKKITDKVRAYLKAKLPVEIARAFKFVTG